MPQGKISINRRANTVLEILIILAILGLVSALVASFFFPTSKEAAPLTEVSKSGQGPVVLTTVKHDNHLWITATTGSYEGGISVVHHPDCPVIHDKQ